MPGNRAQRPDNFRLEWPFSRGNAATANSDTSAKSSRQSLPSAAILQESRCTLPPVKSGEPGEPSAEVPEGPSGRHATGAPALHQTVEDHGHRGRPRGDLGGRRRRRRRGGGRPHPPRRGGRASRPARACPPTASCPAHRSGPSARPSPLQLRARPAVVAPALAGRRPPGRRPPAALGPGPVGRRRSRSPAPGIDAVGRSQSAPPAPPHGGAATGGGAPAARLTGRVHPPCPGSGVNLGPVQGLIGPLATRAEHLPGRPDADSDDPGSGHRRPLPRPRTILQGPATYLLLAGNNAEMRSGLGAFLEAGIVTTGNGELHLSDMVPTTSLTLPPGAVHGRRRSRSPLGLAPPRGRLAKPGAHAAVRRQRPPGRQHVEGQHRPERRRGPRHRRRRASRSSSR